MAEDNQVEVNDKRPIDRVIECYDEQPQPIIYEFFANAPNLPDR